MIHYKKLKLVFLILLMLSYTAHSKRRALVIGIDGLKSTELDRCMHEKKAPNIKKLVKKGISAECPNIFSDTCAKAHDGPRYKLKYSWATGPGWSAVITGLNTEKHTIRNNDHKNLKQFYKVTQKYPTMFSIARKANLQTAIGGVGAFLTSFEGNGIYPGVVDYECGVGKNGPKVEVTDETSCNATYRKALESDSDVRDEQLTEFLIEQIKHTDTDLIMGVLDQVDEAGHKFGFGNNENYLNAITLADELVGRIIHATKETQDEWLYIIVSDHGGHSLPVIGGVHNIVFYEDEVVPFIVSLSNKTPLYPLVYPVRHMDVHPTVLTWLGLRYSADIDGIVQGIN